MDDLDAAKRDFPGRHAGASLKHPQAQTTIFGPQAAQGDGGLLAGEECRPRFDAVDWGFASGYPPRQRSTGRNGALLEEQYRRDRPVTRYITKFFEMAAAT